MRRKVIALAFCVGPSPCRRAPSQTPTLGRANSSKGPNDPGAKCHPRGQTVDRAGLQVGRPAAAAGSCVGECRQSFR
jgi:hypothetical protein